MARMFVEDTDPEIFEEDILEYAQLIGININTEKHLLWIAEEGLAAPVPKPWVILIDKNDRIYYFNNETREISRCHPRDKDYCALVVEERVKSKNRNSPSTDCGFESKLSSLADAPTLSSGKNSPSFKYGKTDTSAGKKVEVGRFENRRGTQLAPVRLNSLKVSAPAAAPKSNSGMSFMPKGSSFSKNVRRVKEEPEYNESNFADERKRSISSHDDINESLNSDEGSKYSYEETDEDEKDMHRMDQYDYMDASPIHSAVESPDALEINSLVQLGTKISPKLDVPKKLFPSASSDNNSPSLSLRKVGQPSVLKPLQQTKKKEAVKNSKVTKRNLQRRNSGDFDQVERYLEDKILALNEDQKQALERIQKEWEAMQDELERKEQEKYKKMVDASSKKLEEEEQKLSKENAETLEKLKKELHYKIEAEQSNAEKELEAIKKTNQEKVADEHLRVKQELENLTKSLQAETETIYEKNSKEISEAKQMLEAEMNKELENLKKSHEINIESIKEAHSDELDLLEKTQNQKVDEIKKTIHTTKMGGENEEIVLDQERIIKVQTEADELEKKIKEGEGKYQDLLKEIDSLKQEISTEKEALQKIKEQINVAQTSYEEIQDEVEKNESDLDLLRAEKSALISELNVLKENISNEKSNLLNLEKKQGLLKEGKQSNSKEFCDQETNTHVIYFNSVSSQTFVDVRDSFCQVKNTALATDVACQSSELNRTMINESCQVELMSPKDIHVHNKITDINGSNALTDSPINKNIENALTGISSKMDSRMKIIEQQVKMLQENLVTSISSKPSPATFDSGSNSLPTEVNSMYATHPVNVSLNTAPAQMHQNSQVSSQSRCRCVTGDPASCEVLQDVKNSVYHLNDILSQSFVPSINNHTFYGFNQPVTSHSNPFDSFYIQFRQLQEKNRIMELKHKCENEAAKQAKSSVKFSGNASIVPQQTLHTTLMPLDLSDDPMTRARNIVLREQARTWKQQQNLYSSLAILPNEHNTSLDKHANNIQPVSYTTLSEVRSFQRSFLNFESDPETDYNNWMTRLNTLQQKIRSHKLL